MTVVRERPAVGQLLQHWRQVRRMSQLALATEARVTPRHVSFVESGRAQPSRDMVITLAGTLDVPLRDRNQMLLAAGYAPVYRETDLDDTAMAPVRAAVSRMLEHHGPYPAVVLDRHWNVTQTNAAASSMFAFLLDGRTDDGRTDDGRTDDGRIDPANVLRLMFDEAGLRPYVQNWDEVAPALLQRAQREAVGGVPDEPLRSLLDEVLALPGIPDRWRTPDFGVALVPVVPVRFARDGVRVNYFSMITTVGTPQDIAAQEIRIESFFPADESTARHRWT